MLNLKSSPQDFLSKILQSRDKTHIQHLNSLSYAEHMALDQYYNDIIPLVDSLIESYQGKYGLVTLTIPPSNLEKPITYLDSLGKYIETNRKQFTDSFLQNQIDTILELIYSTLYKLKFLK